MNKKKFLRGLPVFVSAAAAFAGLGILVKKHATKHLAELDDAFDIDDASPKQDSNPEPETDLENDDMQCDTEGDDD